MKNIQEVRNEILVRVSAEEVKQVFERDLNINFKNNKAVCCFHKEKNPSMSFFEEKAQLKCFSCGKTYNLIDHYIEFHHLDYVTALKRIIEDFSLPIQLEEISVVKNKIKPKKQATLHKEGLSDKAREYLHKRGFTDEFIESMNFKSDDKDNIIFEYRNVEGELLSNKYRPSKKIDKESKGIKTWFEKDCNCNSLYMMEKADFSKPLIITEGEFDALILKMLNYSVVSVPTGCSSKEWIEVNYDFLENFKDIILFFDNDEAGRKAIEEIHLRLPNNVLIARLKDFSTCKDINECYVKGEIQAIHDSIKKAESLPILHTDLLSNHSLASNSNKRTIKTGFTFLDEKVLNGFSLGSLNVLSGFSEAGKSTFLNQLICNFIENNVKNGTEDKVALYSGELSPSLLKEWLSITICEMEDLTVSTNDYGRETVKVNPMVEDDLNAYLDKGLTLVDSDLEVNEMFNVFTQLHCRKGVNIFIIDNLMTIDTSIYSNNTLEGEKLFIRKLKSFAKQYNVVVILVAHLKKPDNEDQEVSKFAISGSASISNYADTVLCLKRTTKKELTEFSEYMLDPTNPKFAGSKKPINPRNVGLYITKNRMTGEASSIRFKYDRTRRRFYDLDTHKKDQDGKDIIEPVKEWKYSYKGIAKQLYIESLLEGIDDEELPF